MHSGNRYARTRRILRDLRRRIRCPDASPAARRPRSARSLAGRHPRCARRATCVGHRVNQRLPLRAAVEGARSSTPSYGSRRRHRKQRPRQACCYTREPHHRNPSSSRGYETRAIVKPTSPRFPSRIFPRDIRAKRSWAKFRAVRKFQMREAAKNSSSSRAAALGPYRP